MTYSAEQKRESIRRARELLQDMAEEDAVADNIRTVRAGYSAELPRFDPMVQWRREAAESDELERRAREAMKREEREIIQQRQQQARQSEMQEEVLESVAQFVATVRQQLREEFSEQLEQLRAELKTRDAGQLVDLAPRPRRSDAA